MRLHLSASGVTTFAPDLTSPPDGYIWKIDHIYIVLNAGATTGTRLFSIYKESPSLIALALVTTGNQTGVSTSYYAKADAAASAATILYHPVVLDADDSLEATLTLLSGDTVTYDIQIDQVIDE